MSPESREFWNGVLNQSINFAPIFQDWASRPQPREVDPSPWVELSTEAIIIEEIPAPR